ncbi:lipid A deacylase LpxR family protein [Halomonas sp. BM-2019]|uniref:lipid A deacylase LpxR family protein n=1 Tax=Halomonas sp. BM-2019 TaxID=2811227 RepID=UPI001B3C3FC2|nr:MAG: lipid A deacylase LpxR family protein [Halomonas sp. BM-2019]
MSLLRAVRRFGMARLLLLAGLSAEGMAGGLLTVKSDNDAYVGGEDGHYTNGLELSWAFQPGPLHWSRRLVEALPAWAADDLAGVAYRASHQIYTPADIHDSRLVADDRPYAGVALGGVSLFSERRHVAFRQVRSLSLDVGVVGPASGAESLQREFHRLLGVNVPSGWEHQLDHEPVLNLAYRSAWTRAWPLGRQRLELGPVAGLALGNLYTYAAAGVGVRFGNNLARSAGIPVMAPTSGGRVTFQRGQGFGWHLFLSLEGRYMAHNLLLDGNTFTSSHSVARKPWVGDVLTGFALSRGRWQLAYSQAWRSDEFKGQEGHHRFGTISLSRWFSP